MTYDPTALKETLDANIHPEDEAEQRMMRPSRKLRARCGHNSTEYDRTSHEIRRWKLIAAEKMAAA